MEKRGQVTIFIIIGIVIVASILVFFLLVRPTFISERTGELNFESCVSDAVEQGVGEIEKNAGYVVSGFSYSYLGDKIPYLCYTPNYLQLCTVYEPLLINHFEEQLGNYVRESVNTCYTNSIGDLKSQGYSVVSGDVDFEVVLEPGIINVGINAPTTVGGSSFERFNVQINSPVYVMLGIAITILQYESSYGDSDLDSLMLLYPDYAINKLKQGDGTTIYFLKNQVYGNEFRFASRSLVYPPGYYIR